jgi:hypothetical protein
MDKIFDRVVSDNGFKIIKGGTTINGSFAGFMVWGLSVITSMKINGVTVDLADFGLDATTLPDGIPAGFPVWFAKDQIITQLVLASGTLYMIKCPYTDY